MKTLHRTLLRYNSSDVHILIVGGLCHSAANTRVIKHDVAQIAVISVFGFVLIYALFVPSIAAIWLLLVPCYAVSTALGIMSITCASLSGLALGFGASVLGIAEDYAVHMHFALGNGDANRILPVIIPSLLHGFLVNVSGFVILLFSGIPAIRQLAYFSILTLTIGFLLAIVILPVCPFFASSSRKHADINEQQRLPIYGITVSCVISLLIICTVLFHLIHVDVSPQTIGAEALKLHQDAEFLRKIWGIDEDNILIVKGQNRDAALATARQIVATLKKLDPNNKVKTLTALLPSVEELQANLTRWHAFTQKYGEHLVQTLNKTGEYYGFSSTAFEPFLQILKSPVPSFDSDVLRSAGLGMILDTYLHEDEKDGAVRILLRTDRIVDISQFDQQIASCIIALSPSDLEKILLKQFTSEKYLVPAAWVICVLLLFLWFRNIPQALLAALPPLCSLCCILTWFVVSGHSLTIAGIAAMPLVLGLSADHGILVTHELAKGVKTGVSRAVLVSSLTTLTSMGLLVLAQHPALHAMGEVIFWGLLVESPAALLLLPKLTAPMKRT
ncbi:MAG: hypothetical protein IJU65_04035 [Desulfovibrio sp.]|nr:hypothetical protein [Desulfovibrio sp.]